MCFMEEKAAGRHPDCLVSGSANEGVIIIA